MHLEKRLLIKYSDTCYQLQCANDFVLEIAPNRFISHKSEISIDSYGSSNSDESEYYFIAVDNEEIITDTLSGGSDIRDVINKLETFVNALLDKHNIEISRDPFSIDDFL